MEFINPSLGRFIIGNPSISTIIANFEEAYSVTGFEPIPSNALPYLKVFKGPVHKSEELLGGRNVERMYWTQCTGQDISSSSQPYLASHVLKIHSMRISASVVTAYPNLRYLEFLAPVAVSTFSFLMPG